jgi:hypothetical protein
VNELSEVGSFFEHKLPRGSSSLKQGPVQSLGVHQKFTIPNDINLLAILAFKALTVILTAS